MRIGLTRIDSGLLAIWGQVIDEPMPRRDTDAVEIRRFLRQIVLGHLPRYSQTQAQVYALLPRLHRVSGQVLKEARRYDHRFMRPR